MLIPILCGVVAVLALLGAFFLARNDRSDGNTQAQVASPKSDTLAEKDQPETSASAQTSSQQTSSQSSLAVNGQLQVASVQDSQPLSALSPYEQDRNNEIIAVSRYLYEIAGQVHLLQRQSQEVERSLAQLSGIVERLQRQVHEKRTSASTSPVYTNNSQPYGESHL